MTIEFRHERRGEDPPRLFETFQVPPKSAALAKIRTGRLLTEPPRDILPARMIGTS
jgi:hypothetical protein